MTVNYTTGPSRIVMKFGGSSLADPNKIEQAARHIVREWKQGCEIAVIVSAMGDTTDALVRQIEQASSLYDAREYDVVVSAGEQVSAGLMAIILQRLGVPSRSWLAWQLPIYTNNRHGRALVEKIEVQQILQRFDERIVSVLGGYQGITREHRITTLGRGGSDTSAVLLAVALQADRCDIYTDVTGVYTTDPRINSRARIIRSITFEEMIELASLGAGVLQTRSVAAAMRYNMPLVVRSTFSEDPGTRLLTHYENKDMEAVKVTGIAYTTNEALITLQGVADKPGISAAIFTALMQDSIFVDMIVQSSSDPAVTGSASPVTNMSFTVPQDELKQAIKILAGKRADIGYQDLSARENIAKISVAGVGMRTTSGVAAQMFAILGERNINIIAITTSEIKISVIIPAEFLELAIRALHTGFDLDSDQ